jgi:hypothetical protein
MVFLGQRFCSERSLSRVFSQQRDAGNVVQRSPLPGPRVSQPAGIVLHLFQRNLDHFHRRSDI